MPLLKTFGQTYINNGSWCYYGVTDQSSELEVYKCTSSDQLFIKWDGKANDVETLICGQS